MTEYNDINMSEYECYFFDVDKFMKDYDEIKIYKYKSIYIDITSKIEPESKIIYNHVCEPSECKICVNHNYGYLHKSMKSDIILEIYISEKDNKDNYDIFIKKLKNDTYYTICDVEYIKEYDNDKYTIYFNLNKKEKLSTIKNITNKHLFDIKQFINDKFNSNYKIINHLSIIINTERILPYNYDQNIDISFEDDEENNDDVCIEYSPNIDYFCNDIINNIFMGYESIKLIQKIKEEIEKDELLGEYKVRDDNSGIYTSQDDPIISISYKIYKHD
jgi:hypothetical protein